MTGQKGENAGRTRFSKNGGGIKHLDPVTPQTVVPKRRTARGPSHLQNEVTRNKVKDEEPEQRFLVDEFRNVRRESEQNEQNGSRSRHDAAGVRGRQPWRHEDDISEEEEEDERPVVDVNTETMEGFRVANRLFIFAPEEPSLLDSIRETRFLQLLAPVWRPIHWLWSTVVKLLNTFIVAPCTFLYDACIGAPYQWLRQAINFNRVITVLGIGVFVWIMVKGAGQHDNIDHPLPTPAKSAATARPAQPTAFPTPRWNWWPFTSGNPDYSENQSSDPAAVERIYGRIKSVEKTVKDLEAKVEGGFRAQNAVSQKDAAFLADLKKLVKENDGNLSELAEIVIGLRGVVERLSEGTVQKEGGDVDSSAVKELQRQIAELRNQVSGNAGKSDVLKGAITRLEEQVDALIHRATDVDQKVLAMDQRLIEVEKRTVPEVVSKRIVDAIREHVPKLVVASIGEDGSVQMQPAFWKYLEERVVGRKEFVEEVEGRLKGLSEGVMAEVRGVGFVTREEVEKRVEGIVGESGKLKKKVEGLVEKVEESVRGVEEAAEGKLKEALKKVVKKGELEGLVRQIGVVGSVGSKEGGEGVPKSAAQFLEDNKAALQDLFDERFDEGRKKGVILTKGDVLKWIEGKVGSVVEELEEKIRRVGSHFKKGGESKEEDVDDDGTEAASHHVHSWPAPTTGSYYNVTSSTQLTHSDITVLVQGMIDSALAKYRADRLAMPDYALESGGARVVPEFTSETFHLDYELSGLRWASRVFGVRKPSGRPPKTALRPDVQPGNCWAMKGNKGTLGIYLSRDIMPTDITLEHTPLSLVASDEKSHKDHDNPLSAPREVEVWAVLDPERFRHLDLDSPTVRNPPLDKVNEKPKPGEKNTPAAALLVDVVFDPAKEGEMGTWPVRESGRRVVEVGGKEGKVGVVVVRVKSNWGNERYSCLYRVRVHGEDGGKRVGEVGGGSV
ncbi:hypothetical protein HDV00_010354 [Rhizophlyctis rosea]|nr:hypothetical protein HDV00_010354 [Rhizophlyctis rosea]